MQISMRISALVLTTFCTVIVIARPHGPHYGLYGPPGYPRYDYNYGVNDRVTGDFKTAREIRDGDLTRGSYSLVQPDGVLRIVNYISDPIRGFQAQVLNKGLSFHARRGAPPGFSYRNFNNFNG